MTGVPPNIKAICDRLKEKTPYRGVSPEIYASELNQAAYYNVLRVCYWTVERDNFKTRYLCLYRPDRAPNNEEILPWLQELFVDGPIHEVSIPNHPFREFFQGGDIYEELTSYADKIAEVIVNQAISRDETEFLPNDRKN